MSPLCHSLVQSSPQISVLQHQLRPCCTWGKAASKKSAGGHWGLGLLGPCGSSTWDVPRMSPGVWGGHWVGEPPGYERFSLVLKFFTYLNFF